MRTKNLIPLLLLVVIVMGSMGAIAAVNDEQLQIDKTATETGDRTGDVTLTVTGSETTEEPPADVVFAIDSSGSMDWNDPYDLRIDATKSFINQMDPTKDKVGVVNWDDDIDQQQALTSDFNTAKDVVDDNNAQGNTDGALGMSTATTVMDGSTLTGNRFIIFLTDGQFNSGSSDPNQAAIDEANKAKAKDYIIYTIGLGTGVNTAVLQQMASGADHYYFATDANALQGIFDDIFASITTAATNLVVTDTTKPGMTYVDGSATKAPDTKVDNGDGTTTLTWNIPSLGAAETWTVKYGVQSANYGEDLPTNTEAHVDYTDPAGAPQNQVFPIPTLDFPAADLAVDKAVDKATQYIGENVIYTITATNNGPSAATGVEVTDLMPSGLEFVSADASGYDSSSDTWTVGNLAKDANKILHITAKVLATGEFTNTATIAGPVTGSLIDPVPGNNQDTATTTGVAHADLAVVKTVDKLAQFVGQNVIYTITVTNNGPSAATGVEVTDLMPSGLDYLSDVASVGSYSDISDTWNIDALANGATATLQITAKVIEDGIFTNTAAVSGEQEDLVPCNNQDGADTSGIANADLSVDKTVNKAAQYLCKCVIFTITATNNGPSDATGVKVTDVLSSGLKFVSADPAADYDQATNTWNIDALANGATATLQLTAKVLETGALANTATVTGTEVDLDPSDNQDTALVTGLAKCTPCHKKQHQHHKHFTNCHKHYKHHDQETIYRHHKKNGKRHCTSCQFNQDPRGRNGHFNNQDPNGHSNHQDVRGRNGHFNNQDPRGHNGHFNHQDPRGHKGHFNHQDSRGNGHFNHQDPNGHFNQDQNGQSHRWSSKKMIRQNCHAIRKRMHMFRKHRHIAPAPPNNLPQV